MDVRSEVGLAYAPLCYINDGRNGGWYRAEGTSWIFNIPELSISASSHQGRRTRIVDAEIAMLDERGVPSFEALAANESTSPDAQCGRHFCPGIIPSVLYVFDLLYINGHDMRGVELQRA